MSKRMWVRRLAAGLALSTVAVVATGSGASAATNISTYSAQASGTTLALSIQLPLDSTLAAILNNAGLAQGINERISFSNATADVTNSKSAGQAVGQVLFGTLDPTILQVSRLLGYTGAELPKAETSVDGAHQAQQSLKPIDIGPVHIGLLETESTSSTVGKLVQTHSASRVLGVKVDLSSVLNQGQIDQLMAPVNNLLNGNGTPGTGLIPQLNQALANLNQTLQQAGINANLSVPSLTSALDKPLVQVGLIESISDTGFDGASRTAKAVTRLANVDLLGGFIHADALNIESFASIDGTEAGSRASAVQRIVGLHVGGILVDLNAGSINVLGHVIALPTDVKSLLNLTVDALGLKVILAQQPQIIRSAAHARSAASSLHVELAPNLGGNKLFSIALDGPASVADVRGGSVLGVKEIRIPTTGVSDTMMWMVGAMLIGLAVAGRRFVLSK